MSMVIDMEEEHLNRAMVFGLWILGLILVVDDTGGEPHANMGVSGIIGCVIVAISGITILLWLLGVGD